MRTVNRDKHAAKQRQILDAAAQVFARCGYDGATTSAICRAAGIGSGTLFHYFPDKRSLMLELFGKDIAANAAFLNELNRAMPTVALWRVVDRIGADLASPLAPGLMTAAMQLALRDEEFAALIETGDARMRGVLAELVKAGQTSGMLTATVDPERAARWIQAVVNAGYFMVGGDEFDADADRAELYKIIASYLGVAEGRT